MGIWGGPPWNEGGRGPPGGGRGPDIKPGELRPGIMAPPMAGGPMPAGIAGVWVQGVEGGVHGCDVNGTRADVGCVECVPLAAGARLCKYVWYVCVMQHTL